MTSWISREEALKAAQVTIFDAKRYLSIFYRFAPPNTITRGNRVSPLVPHILSNFKTMEMAGLTMAQMEQALSESIAQNTLNRNFPAGTGTRKGNETDAHPVLSLLEKVVQNQAEMQNEMVKLIKQFYIELSLLQERTAQLEKVTLRSN